MKVHAIVTAAGTGKRFRGKNRSKSSVSKQFTNLLGKQVFLHSLLVFQRSRYISEILVTSERKYFDLIYKLAFDHGVDKLTFLVEGGKTRFESVRNAFRQINAVSSDLILIHDAVRPNITLQFANGLIKSAIKYGNVIPGVKMGETVKRIKSGYVEETIDRKDLWLIQTPQVFKYSDLANSYKISGRKTDFTDESSLLESAGFKVRIEEGLSGNIKITTPEDISTLKRLMEKS